MSDMFEHELDAFDRSEHELGLMSFSDRFVRESSSYGQRSSPNYVDSHERIREETPTIDRLLNEIRDILHLIPINREYKIANEEVIECVRNLILSKEKAETFHFGKYKGKTIESVYQIDPDYISWAVGNDIKTVVKWAKENGKI